MTARDPVCRGSLQEVSPVQASDGLIPYPLAGEVRNFDTFSSHLRAEGQLPSGCREYPAYHPLSRRHSLWSRLAEWAR